jgi:type III secretion system YscQ/HrcQ family protein
VSTDDPGRGSSDDMPADGLPRMVDSDPLGLLPRLSRRHARLAARLARLDPESGPGAALGWLAGRLGSGLAFGQAEVLGRADGLRRAGVVAVFHWPRLSSRFALGLETTLAHAVVDRLLEFDRPREELRLQVSPVEWGVLTFVAAESLRRLAARPGPLGPWDVVLDRVNPDPFDTSVLGGVVTVRWPLRVGNDEGSLRLWLPDALVARWLATPAGSVSDRVVRPLARAAEMAGTWRALAGTIALPRGLRTLRAGGVLPPGEARLRGTVTGPEGLVELTLSLTGDGGRFVIPAEPAPLSGGARLRLTGPLRFETTPREPAAVSHPATNPDPSTQPTDVPVTLVVEIGRVNLTLGRLADLKPGDVVELGRHSREPVELTTAGRLVARGELVQIDTELGVRVTHVFL